MLDDGKLTPAEPGDLADSITFALNFSLRKRAHDSDTFMARIAADRIVRHLELSGFVVMKKPPSVRGGDNPGRRGFRQFLLVGPNQIPARPGEPRRRQWARAPMDNRMRRSFTDSLLGSYCDGEARRKRLSLARAWKKMEPRTADPSFDIERQFPPRRKQEFVMRTLLAISSVAMLCALTQTAFADEAGAVTGGIGGAAAGAAVGGPVGAVVGGVAGSALGNSMTPHRHYYHHYYVYHPHHHHYYVEPGD
jgi:hypothetical protein